MFGNYGPHQTSDSAVTSRQAQSFFWCSIVMRYSVTATVTPVLDCHFRMVSKDIHLAPTYLESAQTDLRGRDMRLNTTVKQL